MRRAVISSRQPWVHIPRIRGQYSIMIVNPDSTSARMQYVLDKSDYSLLITDDGDHIRSGKDYGDEALLLYTSGTTGDSKFYSFTEAQIELKCQVFAQQLNLTANDRYFGVMPLWHTHGLGLYLATQYIGCETQFGSVKDLKKLQDYQPTFVSAIPDVLRAMLSLQLKNLRYIRSASSALSENLLTMLTDKFAVPVLEGFGMTETMGFCMANPLHAPRPGTVGLPWLESRIDDQGHLWFRAPWCHTDQWFDTGDLAEQDEHGYYRIMGRSVDQLNIRGKKFNPVSIEKQILENIKTIQECVIFGNTDLRCLYVGSADPGIIKGFLASLDKHLKPTLLQAVDQIPTNNGKISRSWLAKNFKKS